MGYSHSWCIGYAWNNYTLSGCHIYDIPLVRTALFLLSLWPLQSELSNFFLNSLIFIMLHLGFLQQWSLGGDLDLDADRFWVFEVGQKYRSNCKY